MKIEFKMLNLKTATFGFAAVPVTGGRYWTLGLFPLTRELTIEVCSLAHACMKQTSTLPLTCNPEREK